MSRSNTHEQALSSEACRNLANRLGFDEYPEDQIAQPYLRYIAAECSNPESLDDFFDLFRHTIDYFDDAMDAGARNRDIQSLINSLCDSDQSYFISKRRSTTRLKEATEISFLILGIWTMMKANFVSLTGRERPIILAYNRRTGTRPLKDPVHQTLSGLIEGSGLLLSPSFPMATHQQMQLSLRNDDPNLQFPIDSMESLFIPSKSLNLSKLCTLAAIRVHWTNNISRHLLLSQHAGAWVVELFALPCIFERGCKAGLVANGVPALYIQEVIESYANLLNPASASSSHYFIARMIWRFCWCLSCTSLRLRRQEFNRLKSNYGSREHLTFDSSLESKSMDLPTDWHQVSFPHLWPRILILETHLQQAKPWNFWVLFRDRREKLPFWTFLFGTMILVMTSIQVMLGIAQVVSGFK